MAKSDITTVKLSRKTKQRLEKLRLHRRETYDEILQTMLGILGTCRTDPEKAQARLRNIERQVRKKVFIEKRAQRNGKINSSSSKSLNPQQNLQSS